MLTENSLLLLAVTAQLASKKPCGTAAPLKRWRLANRRRYGVDLGTIDVAVHQLTTEAMVDLLLHAAGIIAEVVR